MVLTFNRKLYSNVKSVVDLISTQHLNLTLQPLHSTYFNILILHMYKKTELCVVNMV